MIPSLDAFMGYVKGLEDENKHLKNRIEELEHVLIDNGLSSKEYTCQCCGSLYWPKDYDSCRCSSCCHSCYKPKVDKDWIRGKGCPLIRKGNNVTSSS